MSTLLDSADIFTSKSLDSARVNYSTNNQTANNAPTIEPEEYQIIHVFPGDGLNYDERLQWIDYLIENNDILDMVNAANTTININQELLVVKATAADIILSKAGNDVIHLKDSNNITVSTGKSNDIISVAAGNGHVLKGGTGNDRYVIKHLEAKYTYYIDQRNADTKDRDTLTLSSCSKHDFTYTKSEDGNLVMTHTNGASIMVMGWLKRSLCTIRMVL